MPSSGQNSKSSMQKKVHVEGIERTRSGALTTGMIPDCTATHPRRQLYSYCHENITSHMISALFNIKILN
jgi:hypothetical protein